MRLAIYMLGDKINTFTNPIIHRKNDALEPDFSKRLKLDLRKEGTHTD
jgi:hypothetical protein